MMSNPGYDDIDERLLETESLVKMHGNITAAARESGLPRQTIQSRLKALRAKRDSNKIELPEFPDDDIAADAILDTMERRFTQRVKHQRAMHWFPINFLSMEPVGIVVVGDPHLGSNGCNVTLLRQHVKLMTTTPNCYAINIGDTADNWGNRLIRLYAENDVSRSTERRLARWFLEEAGVPWIVWLMGNHDEMDSAFSTYLKAINAQVIPMLDWRARFRLVFPDGIEARVDAAHNHKGHSMWNELHGQERAANMDEDADIFVAGHHHTWALKQKEMPDGRVVHLARARGYKFIDDHAFKCGFHEQQFGSSVMFVIRPKLRDNQIKFIRSFADIEDGCEYLKIVAKKDGK